MSIVERLMQKFPVVRTTLSKINQYLTRWLREDRENRERRVLRERVLSNLAAEDLRQSRCPHQDHNGREVLCLVHNFPDGQPRGICPHCNDLVHPREWRIAAPGVKLPKNTKTNKHMHAYVVPAHKDYGRVVELESLCNGDIVGGTVPYKPDTSEYEEAKKLCEGATPDEIIKAWRSQTPDPNKSFVESYRPRVRSKS